MSHALNKRQKIEQIYQILRDYPDGLTQSELARKLDVYPSTIKKYLDQGDLSYVYEEEGGKRLKLNPEIHLFRLGFSFDEITMLHIAARLLVRQTNQHNPFAAAALRKLAEVIEKADQNISQHLASAASQTDGYEQILNKEFIATLHVLTEARTKGRKVTLEYELETGDWVAYTFAPYFIEPYAPGLTTHVIGKREPPNAIRTFKLERLRNARLTYDPFVIDPDFDPQTLLEHAWGIWYTDRAPELVELKFAPRVKRRVLETRWHRHQGDPEILADGSVIWRCRIAEPKEMLYWIRGWGEDVEVTKPEWLKAEVKLTVEALAENYQVTKTAQIGSGEVPGYRLLWAKADKKTYQIHRLIYHMIDVGQSALVLWQSALPTTLKQRIADWLHLTIDDAGCLIAFWASLHDLGKASPAFQDHPNLDQKVKKKIHKNLIEFGLLSASNTITSTYRHELISTWALQEQGKLGLFASELTMDERTGAMIAAMLGGHHGAWPRPGALDADQLPWDAIGASDAKWNQIRVELFQQMKMLFDPPQFKTFDLERQEDTNLLLTLLSGVVSIADWLGSDEEFFKFKDQEIKLDEYMELAEARAYRAVHRYNWLLKPALTGRVDFLRLFDRVPRPIQEAVINALHPINSPALIVIEAPMGIGKTELALYAADLALQSGKHQGIYIAMPTTATSNQMHERASKFIHARYGSEIAPLLVHSQALLKEEEIKSVSEDSAENDLQNNDRAADLSWFLPRKRSLLATFGVGTVDQALMSVLQTKHFFVRLMGLHQKVVIFDEVHADDIYMLTLFKRLLAWLRELNASVIILSATLSDQTRRELAAAYLGKSSTQIASPPKAYPRLTIAQLGDQTCEITELKPKPKDKHLRIEIIECTAQKIVDFLQKELANVSEGGCVAVICNTIDRAQTVYELLLAAKLVPEKLLILFHARFPYIWRKAIEDNVLSKFGPPDNQKTGDKTVKRPQKSIVVATQVIEQSLDLDFDLMISDLAPIDLLIQRTGRLHRHERNRTLPYRLVLAMPEVKEGLPVLSKIAGVYERATMLKTCFAIRELSSQMMALPSEMPTLIEKVYGEEALTSLNEREQNAINDALQKQQDKIWDDVDDAENRLILPPEDSDLIWGENLGLEEDDPTIHRIFRAMTRKDSLNISLVCVHQCGKQLLVDPKDPNTAVNPYQPKTPKEIQLLLKAVVNIRHFAIVQHFLAEEHQPSAWKRIPALRYHRLVIFQENVYPPHSTKGEWQMELTEKLGLKIITKQETERIDE